MASRSDRRWSRGVSYARFSTEQQDSTDEQHANNAELATQAGIDIVRSFTDEAVSRTVGSRPQFLQMMAFLEENPDVGWVVVGVSDRMTAGLQQYADWEVFAEQHDIRLKTREGDISPLNGRDQVSAAKKAVHALDVVVGIRENTRANLHAKVRDGKTVAMRPAFGVRSKPLTLPDGSPLPEGTVLVDAKGRRKRSQQIEPHPEELPWLRQMFEWVGREGVSMDEVARRLTRAGVRTKTGAVSWRGNSVAGILRNPLYKGDMAWGAQRVVHMSSDRTVLKPRERGEAGRLDFPSPLGALVDPALWELTQEVLARSLGSRPHALRQRNPRRAFDGMVSCARCGTPMYGMNSNQPRKDGTRKDVWRYVCYGPRPGSKQVEGYGPPCSVGHSILEGAIIDALAKLAADPTQGALVVRYAPRLDVKVEEARLKKQKRELESQFKRERELARAGVYSVAEAVELKREHDAAATRLDLNLDSLRSHAVPSTTFTIEAAAALAGVVTLLRERTLAGEVLALGLTDMGITRVFVDNPRVEIEWVA